MKTKKTYSLFLTIGLLLFALSFIATSKYNELQEDPCYLALQNRFNTDTSISNHVIYDNIISDTLLLRGDTLLPADWNRIADTICKVYKTNCVNNGNKPILIVNRRNTTASEWDTRFGKKILFKLCP
jgi:hypothetical protein